MRFYCGEVVCDQLEHLFEALVKHLEHVGHNFFFLFFFWIQIYSPQCMLPDCNIHDVYYNVVSPFIKKYEGRVRYG